MSGQTQVRALIASVSKSVPCRIETTEANQFESDQQVRITDLNSVMPILRGMDQINNRRFKIKVIDDTHFDLYDPITNLPIDSTHFVTYVEGGRVDLISQNFTYEGE